MTLDGFLAWEERQELRYEFDGLQPVAMTGGTYAHDIVTVNLTIVLGNRLRGTRCRPHGPNLKVLSNGKARYPDVLVMCQTQGNTETIAREPVVIFEVLSPGTAGTDRIGKVREYTALPSLQRYVLLEQDRAAATVLERQDARWVTTVLTDDATLSMPEIGIDLNLTELYDGVSLAPGPTDDAA